MTYIYKPNDRNPHEYLVCPGCGETKLIRRGCTYCSFRCRNLGPNNPGWVGDGVRYRGAHTRVTRTRGKASEYMCACGKRALDWANLTGRYPDVEDYEPMCRSCHMHYDKRRRLSVGDGSG